MGPCAFGSSKFIRLSLVPAFMMALFAGCDSDHPTFSNTKSGSETATAQSPGKRPLEERQKAPRSSNRAAAGARPTGAE